jgi:hypothetical protein
MCATRVLSGVVFISVLIVGSTQAKNKTSYARGVLSEMQSVSCGYMQKSGPTVAGALITGAEHSKSRELLCQEYTLKTDRVTYRIRPKEEKHPALLPVGEEAEFRLKKDQMLLRIPEADNKEREYIVVSMAPTQEFASEIESTRRPPKPHGKALKADGSGPVATSGMAAASDEAPEANTATAAANGANAAPAESVALASTAVPATTVATQQAPAAPANAASPGSLQVQSSPAGAEIYVDSAIAGRTPALLTLKPGPHSIQVVMAGYRDWVTNVNVAPGARQQVSVNLSR